MKVAVEKTGGLVVLSESFGHSVFKDSFKRVFEDGEQSLGLCFKWVFFISIYFTGTSILLFHSSPLRNYLFWLFALSLILYCLLPSLPCLTTSTLTYSWLKKFSVGKC